MSVKSIDTSSAPHYTWGNNCDSWVLTDTANLSVKQEKMPSGTKEKWHFHTIAQQFFYILKGTATFYTNNETTQVNAHQGISIPANTKHYIANESPENLEFLVISQPNTLHDRTEIES